MIDEVENYKKAQDEKNNYWWTVEFSTALTQNDRSLKEELMSTVASISDSIGLRDCS